MFDGLIRQVPENIKYIRQVPENIRQVPENIKLNKIKGVGTFHKSYIHFSWIRQRA